MANKETKTAEVTAEETKTAEVKEKTYKIRIPRLRDDESDVFVSVNDDTWLIQRGKEVEVPECVYEVLCNQDKALEAAMDFESTLNKY